MSKRIISPLLILVCAAACVAFDASGPSYAAPYPSSGPINVDSVVTSNSASKPFVQDTLISSDTSGCEGCGNENQMIGIRTDGGGGGKWHLYDFDGDNDATVASEGYVDSSTSNRNILGPLQNVQTNFKGRPVYLTIDDDLGEDVDGVGSVAVAFRLSDLDQVSVVGTSYVGNHWYGAPDFSALNTFYGGQTIPVGTQRPAGVYTGADYYGTFLAGYPNTIGQGVNDTNGFNTTNAIAMYRRLLQAAPAHSVTMLFEGQMTNLYGLYNSPADSVSPLTGAQLVINKVKQLVILGGVYPSGFEFDFYSDPASAQVINQLDGSIPVIYSGYDYGFNVLTKSNQPLYSTIRAAYDKFFQTFGGTTRSSWGAMAVLYCVRGLSFGSDTYSTLSAQGTNHVDMAGNNVFTTGGSKNQHYLILAMNPDTMATRIQALMDTLPKATSSAGTLEQFGMYLKTPLYLPAMFVNGNLFAGNTNLTGWAHLNGFTVDGQAGIFGARATSASNGGYSWSDEGQTNTWYLYQNSVTNPNLLHLYYPGTTSDLVFFNGTDTSSNFQWKVTAKKNISVTDNFASENDGYTLASNAYASGLQNYTWKDQTGANLGAIGVYYDGTKSNFKFHSLYDGAYKNSSSVVFQINGDSTILTNGSITTNGSTADVSVNAGTTVLKATGEIRSALCGGLGNNFIKSHNDGTWYCSDTVASSPTDSAYARQVYNDSITGGESEINAKSLIVLGSHNLGSDTVDELLKVQGHVKSSGEDSANSYTANNNITAGGEILATGLITANGGITTDRIDGDTTIVANELKLLYPTRGVLYTNGASGMVTQIDTIGIGRLTAKSYVDSISGANTSMQGVADSLFGTGLFSHGFLPNEEMGFGCTPGGGGACQITHSTFDGSMGTDTMASLGSIRTLVGPYLLKSNFKDSANTRLLFPTGSAQGLGQGNSPTFVNGTYTGKVTVSATSFANISVNGSSGSPSLTSDANNIFGIGGTASPQIVFGNYNGGDFGMWMQTKTNNNSGGNWPLHINPLGGNVNIGTASDLGSALGVTGNITATTLSIGAGSPFIVNTFGDVEANDVTIDNDLIFPANTTSGTGTTVFTITNGPWTGPKTVTWMPFSCNSGNSCWFPVVQN